MSSIDVDQELVSVPQPTSLSEALAYISHLQSELQTTKSQLNNYRSRTEDSEIIRVDRRPSNPNPTAIELTQIAVTPSSSTFGLGRKATTHSYESLPTLNEDPSFLMTRSLTGTSQASSDDPEPHQRGTGERFMTLDEYFQTPLWRILLKRLPWLVGLLFIQSFSASILHAFESFIEDHIAIAFFVSMIVGTGGNAGNQPGVMITRALAVGDIPVRRLLLRETILSAITACVLSTVAFLRVIVEYPDDIKSALALAIALFFIIMVSIYLGVLFSTCIGRFKNCDPADGSAPLLATISDLIGISILCGFAYAIVD